MVVADGGMLLAFTEWKEGMLLNTLHLIQQNSPTAKDYPAQNVNSMEVKKSFVFNGMGYLSLNSGINSENYLWVIFSARDSRDCL